MNHPDTDKPPVALLEHILPIAKEHCSDHIKGWVEEIGRALVASGQQTGELDRQTLREWLYRVGTNLSWEGAELLQDALDVLRQHDKHAGSRPMRP